jgi:hypothetical protein
MRTFENEDIRHHVVNELLVNIAHALAGAVSAETGIKIAPLSAWAVPRLCLRCAESTG